MDKLNSVIGNIPEPDQRLFEKTQKRLDNLTKPVGSLGRLEELARLIVSMTGREKPSLPNKVIFTLAADHGVTEEGVSAYPKEVTPQMVYNFLRGGAGINVLAAHVGARVVVADVGVAQDLIPHPNLVIQKIGYGTRNMANGPAMTRNEAVAAVEAGVAIFETEYEKGVDIVGTGDMGIGNTTASSAITAVITGAAVKTVTGRGTGIDEGRLKNKVDIIEKALTVNKPAPADALEVLSKVGGFEIGGLAGVILAAAARKVPVMLDGFISGAAALIACGLAPKAKHYLIASHCSVERGHKILLDHLGLGPLLDLDLRLGEGTGAALGIGLAEAAVKILTQMATFEEAGVSGKS
ncbi:MAG TPA: nicotinate-nucleotide--dimethylbenzimidazole phosphoribosyltransferase [Elusimicrobiota bacterium]|nr:nicotinate-nucleotide--dimethylbenzimidazole phosphoribosyltransferase [Elusimicrobiota bacterium]